MLIDNITFQHVNGTGDEAEPEDGWVRHCYFCPSIHEWRVVHGGTEITRCCSQHINYALAVTEGPTAGARFTEAAARFQTTIAADKGFQTFVDNSPVAARLRKQYLRSREKDV